MEVLFLFRFYILDLWNQLRQLCHEQKKTFEKVYRRQVMSKDDSSRSSTLSNSDLC